MTAWSTALNFSFLDIFFKTHSLNKVRPSQNAISPELIVATQLINPPHLFCWFQSGIRRVSFANIISKRLSKDFIKKGQTTHRKVLQLQDGKHLH